MKKITLLAIVITVAFSLNAQMMLQLDGKFQGIGAFASESNSRTGTTTTSKSGSGAVQIGYGLGFSKKQSKYHSYCCHLNAFAVM